MSLISPSSQLRLTHTLKTKERERETVVQPFGSILPVAEMQARWVAAVLAGTCALPAPAAMRDAIDLDWLEHTRLFLPRERHMLQVDYVPYLDDLAARLGCAPDVWAVARRSWRLALALVFGPALPQHYRLCGPGRDETGAAERVIVATCFGREAGTAVAGRVAKGSAAAAAAAAADELPSPATDGK